MIHFEIPKNQSSIIKVIGVGGGGGNAVNYMYQLGIDGVDFVICNTDSQALALSPIPNKIQLGPHLTQGLGAGANPDVGRLAGEESIDDITKILKVNTKMAFITAGMGGGTGTGGAPIIAKVCKDLGILTVGIVTTPFSYEGRKRITQAAEGIEALRENVDTILIISNDKLRQQFGNLPFSEAFSKADNILATAAKCITDLITVDGRVNLDFNDVQTVMRNGGRAILGSAICTGEDRAMKAVEQALNSPLLNDNEIIGANWILLNITSAKGEYEHSLDELDIIQGYVQQQAGNNCNIILGMGNDDNLGESLSVSIIATGFDYNEVESTFFPEPAQEPEKIIVSLEQPGKPQAVKTEVPTPVVMEDPFAPKMVDVNIKKVVENPNLKVISTDGVYEPPKVQSSPSTQPSSEISMSEVTTDTVHEKESTMPKPKSLMQELEEEEQRRHEEQKKALEDRAERLRQMTTNVSGTESHHEVENVPAYIRKNIPMEDPKDNTLSGYTTDGDTQKKNGFFNTINTFLQGKKPD